MEIYYNKELINDFDPINLFPSVDRTLKREVDRILLIELTK